MSRRKPCEPLGPIYMLRSVRDQIALFQERRGILPEENNFVNLIAVMVSQSGNALYAVFTMFLALLPAATIFIHLLHFLMDRILDICTTRRKYDLSVKVGIFLVQLIVLFFATKFIMAALFIPIFSMQTSIISRMILFGGSHNGDSTLTSVC